ncbi:hypothetical protein CpipJ_CPIJ017960, partial [Culex quinquefasciatus]
AELSPRKASFVSRVSPRRGWWYFPSSTFSVHPFFALASLCQCLKIFKRKKTPIVCKVFVGAYCVATCEIFSSNNQLEIREKGKAETLNRYNKGKFVVRPCLCVGV